MSVIADLYKTDVHRMVHWLNNEYLQKLVITKDILRNLLLLNYV